MSAPVAERERRLAERLLEDEALRGDLDDATWQPIQDWLLRQAARLAAATTEMDDSGAEAHLERGRRVLREVVQAMGNALSATDGQSDGLDALHHAIEPPVFDPSRARRVHAALRAVERRLARERPPAPLAAGRLLAALDLGARG